MVKRPPARRTPDRLKILAGLLLFAAGIILWRLFALQVPQHEVYAALAEGQQSVFSKLFPRRGEVYLTDRSTGEGRSPFAINRRYDLLYAVPTEVKEPTAVAKILATLLSESEGDLLAKLVKPDDAYEALSHRVTPELRQQIEALNLAGIHFQKETLRYYPDGHVGSHVAGFLGYVGDERRGQYGVEGFLDEELRGTPGTLNAEGSGSLKALGGTFFEEAQDGSDVMLTIDRTIEFRTCEAIAAAVERHGATKGVAIVMEPSTGKILGLCGAPDFDPNEYSKVEDISVFNNLATYGAYEPGSVFKAITMAAALDAGLVTPTTTYTDTGSVQIGKFTIRNSDGKAHGVQTMTQVLEESLNTGAIFVSDKLGLERFRHDVEQFGFGQTTGIEVDGEVRGDLSALKKKGDIYLATASFGQGITVTPIQLLSAFAAIANDGKLMRPSIVESFVRPEGTVERVEPKVVRQVVSPTTATTITAMLASVVERGHGQRAGVDGYYIAGKTGTAQVRAADSPNYDPSKTIGTFVGFGPVANPAFAMLIRIDDPKDVQFAESSAAPVFGEIAKFLLDYLKVPPDRTTDNEL